MSLRYLRSICRALIGIVLFAQIAISAYACPALSAVGTMSMTMAMAAAESPPPASSEPSGVAADLQAIDCADMAGTMDDASPNLCSEHCRYGHQSDQAASLTVPAALLNALYVTPLAPEPIVAPRATAAQTGARAAASPPHAILHCCFRI